MHLLLIDQFLPQYHFNEHHSRVIDGKLADIYDCTRNFKFQNTLMMKILFILRGLPIRKLSLQAVLDMGFILLGEEKNKEFVLGLVGKFWTLGGHIQRLNPEEFKKFSEPGFAKTAANFTFESLSDTSIKVSTETRIFCLDNSSQRKFGIYWSLIKPFSGLIRKEILRSIGKGVA